MVKTIFLSDVLKEMKKLDNDNNPIPFSISGYSFSSQNNTGGKFYEYKNATLMQPPKVKGEKRLSDPTPFKNPNHYQNYTRNIKTDKGIKKINILFVLYFNGYQVVY